MISTGLENHLDNFDIGFEGLGLESKDLGFDFEQVQVLKVLRP